MPPGEGYWLHTSGKQVEVFEHFSDVLRFPRKYGVREEAIARLPGEQDDVHRRRVLTEVLKKNWIRVRSHKGYTVFEFWKLTNRVADTIWGFVSETLWAGPGTSFNLHELATSRGCFVRMESFYDDIEPCLHGTGKVSRANGARKLYLTACSLGLGRCAV